MPTLNFRIVDLSCAACVKLSASALSKIPGVTGAKIDLATGRASVDSSESVSWPQIEEALRSVGKTPAKD